MLLLKCTLLLLTVAANASPVKRSGGGDIDGAINIITGNAGDTAVISNTDCSDKASLCHELCHVVQQDATLLAQCYDSCYRDLAIECDQAANVNGGGNGSAGSVGS